MNIWNKNNNFVVITAFFGDKVVLNSNIKRKPQHDWGKVEQGGFNWLHFCYDKFNPVYWLQKVLSKTSMDKLDDNPDLSKNLWSDLFVGRQLYQLNLALELHLFNKIKFKRLQNNKLKYLKIWKKNIGDTNIICVGLRIKEISMADYRASLFELSLVLHRLVLEIYYLKKGYQPVSFISSKELLPILKGLLTTGQQNKYNQLVFKSDFILVFNQSKTLIANFFSNWINDCDLNNPETNQETSGLFLKDLQTFSQLVRIQPSVGSTMALYVLSNIKEQYAKEQNEETKKNLLEIYSGSDLQLLNQVNPELKDSSKLKSKQNLQVFDINSHFSFSSTLITQPTNLVEIAPSTLPFIGQRTPIDWANLEIGPNIMTQLPEKYQKSGFVLVIPMRGPLIAPSKFNYVKSFFGDSANLWIGLPVYYLLTDLGFEFKVVKALIGEGKLKTQKITKLLESFSPTGGFFHWKETIKLLSNSLWGLSLRKPFVNFYFTSEKETKPVIFVPFDLQDGSCCTFILIREEISTNTLLNVKNDKSSRTIFYRLPSKSDYDTLLWNTHWMNGSKDYFVPFYYVPEVRRKIQPWFEKIGFDVEKDASFFYKFKKTVEQLREYRGVFVPLEVLGCLDNKEFLSTKSIHALDLINTSLQNQLVNFFREQNKWKEFPGKESLFGLTTLSNAKFYSLIVAAAIDHQQIPIVRCFVDSFAVLKDLPQKWIGVLPGQLKKESSEPIKNWLIGSNNEYLVYDIHFSKFYVWGLSGSWKESKKAIPISLLELKNPKPKHLDLRLSPFELDFTKTFKYNWTIYRKVLESKQIWNGLKPKVGKYTSPHLLINKLLEEGENKGLFVDLFLFKDFSLGTKQKDPVWHVEVNTPSIFDWSGVSFIGFGNYPFSLLTGSDILENVWKLEIKAWIGKTTVKMWSLIGKNKIKNKGQTKAYVKLGLPFDMTVKNKQKLKLFYKLFELSLKPFDITQKKEWWEVQPRLQSSIDQLLKTRLEQLKEDPKANWDSNFVLSLKIEPKLELTATCIYLHYKVVFLSSPDSIPNLGELF